MEEIDHLPLIEEFDNDRSIEDSIFAEKARRKSTAPQGRAQNVAIFEYALRGLFCRCLPGIHIARS
ncbi:MAG TPA: hypothetical protein VG672_00680 [Bryobacteraceae bacterium]|nr:hypothetical protein [Bryobacteraceae bacterium]